MRSAPIPDLERSRNLPISGELKKGGGRGKLNKKEGKR
jgi:hypothetical protein